ncbi:MAG: hypothetical protein MJ250_04705 [Alphaproteobacteria bacterium]|nr:hypothetical protein [Alphaproteobacteria bacterium]
MPDFIQHSLTKAERDIKRAEKAAKNEQNRLEKIKNLPDSVHGAPMIEIEYTTISSKELKNKRKEFNGYRKDFLKMLATEQVAQLKLAGLTDKHIELIAKGQCPNGWNVHHKKPLGGGGKNEFSNFILIKNDPYHTDFHKTSDLQLLHMNEGETRVVKMPTPVGNVFISPEQQKQNELTATALRLKMQKSR